MPAVLQSMISDVTERILNHICQTPHVLEGTLNPARTDKTNLQGIDGEIDALEETLRSLQISLNTRIIQRKKHRNNLILFNQLPLEIASNILWLSIADPWPKMMDYSFLQRQKTISSVCTSWWRLVEDSPRFWSIIEFSCPLAAISHSLKKSQSSDLEIKSFTDKEYNCAPMELFTEEACLRLIAPHADQIRSLILSLSSSGGLLTVLGNPAPMLEEVKIDSPHCYFAQPWTCFVGRQVG